MDIDVQDRLIAALRQLESCQSAGSTSLAVADGYLSIDNHFSAALLLEGIDPPRCHPKKLDAAWEVIGADLEAAQVSKEELLTFYSIWQDVRYSSISPPVDRALRLRQLTFRVRDTVYARAAEHLKTTTEAIADELHRELFGSDFTALQDEFTHVHEAWQERYGNEGWFQPANFSYVQVFTDDPLTRDILARNEEIAAQFGDLYNRFLATIEALREARFQAQDEQGTPLSFTLGLRLRYESEDLNAEGQRFIQRLDDAMRRAGLDPPPPGGILGEEA